MLLCSSVLHFKACFKLCGDVMLATSTLVAAMESKVDVEELCLVVAELLSCLTFGIILRIFQIPPKRTLNHKEW